MVRLLVASSLFLFVNSCGAFGYKSYNVLPAENGDLQAKLEGEKPQDDTTAKQLCYPDAQHKVKCVLLTVDEYFRLLADKMDIEIRLKECEKRAKD